MSKQRKSIIHKRFWKISFSIWVFFHEHYRFTGQQGKREGIYLTFLNHFHLLHRHVNISRAITAESSPLQELTSAHSEKPDSNREPLVSESKLLTTKLSALKYEPKKIKMENLIDDDLEKSSSDESSESDNDSNDEKVMMNPMNNLLKVF